MTTNRRLKRFLRALAIRYKGHPGLGGYDIWNECNYGHNTCYCPATEQKFREWLKASYGDLRTLGNAWHRHSFAEWEDVTIPRHAGPYPDTLDWLQFRIDNAYALMHWRAELIRSIDPDCAHYRARHSCQPAEHGPRRFRRLARRERSRKLRRHLGLLPPRRRALEADPRL